jgi:3-deoxy-D-manno-octulosonate 8-phosphate phosphatase (KDO 8-P phosphatase)
MEAAMNDDAMQKATRVKLLIMDVDGVLTDGTAFYGSEGFEAIGFNVKDGTGIKYLHRSGIRTALLSGRNVAAVRERARVLGIDLVYQGIKVKIEAYEDLLRETGLTEDEVAYIGDDLPDIPVMRRVGFAAAVADAMPEVAPHADYVTEEPGGRGAVRELAELILKAQGKWADITERYLS